MDSNIQDLLESELKDQEYPDFDPGDTICVRTREEIGGQMRNREFEGVCISRSGKGPDQTFKVRKDSFGVGVERIFPLYSPMIEDVEIIRKGKVRRAKLNYLEGRSQKDARIEEERVDLEEANRVESDQAEESSETQEETDEADEAQSPSDDTADEETAEDDSGTDESEVDDTTDQEEVSEAEPDEDASEDASDESSEENADDEGEDAEADAPAEEASDDAEEDESSEDQKEEVGESV